MTSFSVQSTVSLAGSSPDLIVSQDALEFWKVMSTGDSMTEGAPMVWIHPADGSLLLYRHLLEGLQGWRKLIAFEAPTYNDLSAPLPTSLREAARHYTELLHTIHGGSSYILGGYSYGGLVAYEMAQILRSAGREVECLLMIEVGNPAVSVTLRSSKGRMQAYLANRQASHPLHKATLLSGRFLSGLLGRLRYECEEFSAKTFSAKAGSARRQVQLRNHHGTLFDEYRPKPYEGKARLWFAEDQGDKYLVPENLGWDGMLTGDVEIYQVPGSHLDVLEKPNVERVLDGIRSQVAKPTGSSGA